MVVPGILSGCNAAVGVLAAAVILSAAAQSPPDPETLSNIPQTLSGDDGKPARIQRPKSRKAESCTIKCVTTCIRGGAGSPGEGPLNARSSDLAITVSSNFENEMDPMCIIDSPIFRPLVVFKDSFRSRNYCLVECSDICNLIKDGEEGN